VQFAQYSFIQATQRTRHGHTVIVHCVRYTNIVQNRTLFFRLHVPYLAQLANIGLHLANIGLHPANIGLHLANTGLHLAPSPWLLLTGCIKQPSRSQTAAHNSALAGLCCQPEKVSRVYLQRRRTMIERQQEEEHEGQAGHQSGEQRELGGAAVHPGNSTCRTVAA
jgi:hypothetical protein